MEYENPQSRDETTALEAATQHTDAIAPNSDAKGELLPEIGMGIVGEIIAMGIAFGLCYLYDYTHPCTRGVSCGMGWAAHFLLGWPLLSILLAIPLVAECVRFAGMRSGGHAKRKRCYIGTVLVFAITSISLAIGTRDDSAFVMIYLLLIPSSPILLLMGAIKGYRGEKIQPHDAPPVLEAATQDAIATNPNGKGKLLPEIGMGIVGGILALVVMIKWQLSFCVCASPEWCDYNDAYTACGIADRLIIFALPLLVAVPIMAECVRFGGVRSGGHGKRMRCYIGAAASPGVLLLISFLFPYGPFMEFFMQLAIPVLLFAGAIVGYRKDAECFHRRLKGTASASSNG